MDKPKVSKIANWKPKKHEVVVEPDGELFVCNFDRVFNQKKLKAYNKFMLKKDSYENQLDTITLYANFFMALYDADDELVNAYLKCKFALDKNKLFGKDDMEAFIDFIYEIMFTPTMVQKIVCMVEDNYLDDIECDSESKSNYKKNEKKHMESLEFTNEQIKILLEISFAIKIMSPVMFHYFAINVIKVEKDSDMIYNFYKRLFEIFGKGSTYNYYSSTGEILSEDVDINLIQAGVDRGEITKELREYETIYHLMDGSYYKLKEINMYNKLYVYVKAKVLESSSNNSIIFEQREIFGVDVFSVIKKFTNVVLISENMVKYKFNSTWNKKTKKYDESVIGFNKTIIKFQLSYFLKEQYKKNLTEVTNTKNAEGLSGLDKLLMNLNKIDEGSTLLSDINIKCTMEKLMNMIDVDITEEEIQYYMDHMKIEKYQVLLIYSYFAKYFGNIRDLNLLSRRNYIILSLLLKKKLLIDFGFDEKSGEHVHYSALPYILTGNLDDKLNTRIIRNNKFITKIEESDTYQHLCKTKFVHLLEIDPDYILSMLSTMINSRFSYVTYENQDLLGEEITYSDDKISDEILFFLATI